jgi:hypothetical protein
VAIIALVLAAVCLLCVLYWVELYRRKCVEAEALRVALQYQYPKSITLYNLEGQEEIWREKDEQLAAQTEKLHQRFIAARSRLNERWRLNPLRDSLLNRRVFEYEVAKNRFRAAEQNGPLQISVGAMPDFLKSERWL